MVSSRSGALKKKLFASALMPIFLSSAPVYAQDDEIDESIRRASVGTILLETVVIGSGDDTGVVAYKSQTGMKTDIPILETPQSVSVVTRKQLDEQKPINTSAALRYTAGATSEAYGAFGNYIDITRIRGIQADYYLDGLRVISNQGSWLPQIDPFALQRIEVLRGPSSALYGQGTGGGIINQISRRPEAVTSHEMILQYGSYQRKSLGFDSTGPLNADGTFLYRLTTTGLETNDQVEDKEHQRFYIAPAITWRPDASTSWTVMATYSREPHIPDYIGLPGVLLGLNHSHYPQLNRKRNYTDIDYNASTRNQASVSSFFEHEFDNGWKLTSNSRYMSVESHIKRSIVYGFTDVGGAPYLRGYYEDTPAEMKSFSTDNYISGKFDLGPTEHNLLIGFDYSVGNLSNALYSVGPILFDPFKPDYRTHIIPDFTASRAAPWKVDRDFNRTGIYAQDQIALDKWRLTLGGRYDWSNSDDETYSYSATPRNVKNQDRAWSSRIGLGYQFDNGIAPYISYSTAFDPLLESDWEGKMFQPVESRQTEIGIKYSPPESIMMLSAAIFELEQTNVKTGDALHLGYNMQAGEVRTRGLDLQASAEIGLDFEVVAGYTYLDNEVLKDTRYQGNGLTQIPKHTASLWLNYHMEDGPLRGLSVGGGMRYLGSTYGDPTNNFKVPGVTLVDLALNYDFEKISEEFSGASLALNVSNLFDKDYVASCTSQLYCFVGSGRTITASMNYRW
ncbi:TonB-dependent siderophore receptor [Bartonella sp. LJL80]